MEAKLLVDYDVDHIERIAELGFDGDLESLLIKKDNIPVANIYGGICPDYGARVIAEKNIDKHRKDFIERTIGEHPTDTFLIARCIWTTYSDYGTNRLGSLMPSDVAETIKTLR